MRLLSPVRSGLISIVVRLAKALKGAKSLRGKQEKLFSKERGVRFAKATAMKEKMKGKGRAQFLAYEKPLKGELAKVQFESIVEIFTEENITHLYNLIGDSKYLIDAEQNVARKGLDKIFGYNRETGETTGILDSQKGTFSGGSLPTKQEISFLDKVFGSDFTKALLDQRR